MHRTLTQTWWLLALCGVADAMHAAMNLLMLSPSGHLSLRRLAVPNEILDIGILSIAAGACAIAMGLWSAGRNYSWLLSLHGSALAAFGVIAVSPLVKGPLSFRPVSLLFVAMASSMAAFAFLAAQIIWARLAGAVSIGFALSFIAVGFNWVKLGSPESFWIWMSSYFAFCAIFMLSFAALARSRSLPGSGQGMALPPFQNPRPAH
jgi:hypothetical protein